MVGLLVWGRPASALLPVVIALPLREMYPTPSMVEREHGAWMFACLLPVAALVSPRSLLGLPVALGAFLAFFRPSLSSLWDSWVAYPLPSVLLAGAQTALGLPTTPLANSPLWRENGWLGAPSVWLRLRGCCVAPTPRPPLGPGGPR